MIKAFITEAIISKGYDGAPALRYTQGEKGDSVRFRIGMRVYDTRAENNTRWFNLPVKAFGAACERIKRMQLKEGSFINLLGRLDEESWEDPNTHELRKSNVIILDEVEYCYSGNNNKQSEAQEETLTQPKQSQNAVPKQETPAAQNFTGFEAFAPGGENPFY